MNDQTLKELLEKFKSIDDDLPPEEFDPAVLVGDLKDKIDAIKWRLDEWEAKAEVIQKEWIVPLARKAASLLKKRDRLTEYIRSEMVKHNFETLPGTLVRVDLRKSPMKVETTLDASAETYLKFQEFMRQDVDYSWDKKNIKAALESGRHLEFATLSQGNFIKFEPKKG